MDCEKSSDFGGKMKYINADNLLDYAFVNEDALVYPLRGICIAILILTQRRGRRIAIL